MYNPEINVHSVCEIEVPGTKRKLKISFETIPPEVAEIWLNENSENQRKLNNKIVGTYTSQIKKDLWFPDTGESIKFSAAENGESEKLIDGQHRLRSVVAGGKPQIFMVIRNIDPDHIVAMDLGKKRSLQDIMTVNGFEPMKYLSNKVLGSVLSGIYIAKQYASKQRTENKTYRIDRIGDATPSPVELFEFLQANPEITERLKKLENKDLSAINKHVGLAQAIIGWYLVDVMDEEIADQILMTMQELTPQTSLGRSCPAFAVYSYIQKARANDNTVNKHYYPGMFIWAYDKIARNSPHNDKTLGVSREHLPAQGHENTIKLAEYLKELKTVS